MAHFYYRFGTMDCGKTSQLLIIAENYEKRQRNVLLFKSILDVRSSNGCIESRDGKSHKCVDMPLDFDVFKYVENVSQKSSKAIECILVDECQFLSVDQVKELGRIASKLNIPVICYGLKNSFVEGKLFSGSEALLYFADKFEEVKNVCAFCNRKAIMNLHIVKGKPEYSGDVIHCGDTKKGEDYYLPTCREHYYNPIL